MENLEPSKPRNTGRKLNTVLVDNRKIITVNGINYIEREQEKPSKKFQDFMMINALVGINLDNLIKTRKLPENIDIIKEYGLIELKQSKLSSVERRLVVFEFEKKYKSTI
jgi:hypothetical protein